MNQLICDGVRLGFTTHLPNLEAAVYELEARLKTMGIEVELSGMMRLYDEANRLLEVC